MPVSPQPSSAAERVDTVSATPPPSLSPVPSGPEAAPRPAPASHRELFLAFTSLALQGFGGVVAVVQTELVERRRWMTQEEFIEDWAVAQVMPGPNVINISLMLGGRCFGWRGACTAVAGLLAAPLVVVLALALLYDRFQQYPQVAGALRAMSFVTAGLLMATGLKLVRSLRKHPLGLPLCLVLCAVCFVAIAIVRVPLMSLLVVVGGLACTLTWRKLAP